LFCIAAGPTHIVLRIHINRLRPAPATRDDDVPTHLGQSVDTNHVIQGCDVFDAPPALGERLTDTRITVAIPGQPHRNGTKVLKSVEQKAKPRKRHFPIMSVTLRFLSGLAAQRRSMPIDYRYRQVRVSLVDPYPPVHPSAILYARSRLY
jgi:hypothetical protein